MAFQTLGVIWVFCIPHQVTKEKKLSLEDKDNKSVHQMAASLPFL